MPELKPCPFCGKPVQMFYNSMDNVFKIYHKNGDDEMDCCVIEPIMFDAVSLAEAAKMWNRRLDDDEF